MEIYEAVKEISVWVSLALGIYIFYKWWNKREGKDLDLETTRLIKQSKTMWGENLTTNRLEKLEKSKNLASAKKKIGKYIKSKTLGVFDELTDSEVHDYILNEDTMKTLSAGKKLFGGLFDNLLEGFNLSDLFKRDPKKKDDKDKYAMKPE